MASATGTETETGTGGSVVLWVGDPRDDDPLPSTALEEAMPEWDVLAESDFARALDRVRDGEVDGVVSDHRESGFDGVAFLEAVRKYSPETPFVLAPTDGSEAVAARAVELDATAYVPRTDGGAVVAERISGAVSPGLRDRGSDPIRMPIRNLSMEEELRLKERAMDEAPVGITISSGEDPDTPLVYANDSFVGLTGYEKDDIMGVNCRFLQGPESDPEKVTRMREAIENEEQVSVELKNYRKDGTEFWNAVDIYPIPGPDGEVTHYAGFQTDITARKRAQMQLEAEREDLRRVLARIEGLLEDVTEIAVRSDSRRTLQREVVQRVGMGGEYALAWIGDLDPTRESIRLVEWAGMDVDFGFDEVELDSERVGSRAIREAIEGGTVTTVDALAEYVSPVARPDDSLGACAFVPLSFGEAVYGVLAVYVEAPEVLDEQEKTLLESLGRIIATGINASESRRFLFSDTVVEFLVSSSSEALIFAALSRRLGCDLDFEDVFVRADGTVVYLFDVRGTTPEELTAAVEADDDVERGEVLAEHDDEFVYQFVLSESPLVRLSTEYGGRLSDLQAQNGECRIRFEVTDQESARSLLDDLRDRYGPIELLEYHESENVGRTDRGFRATVNDRLTDRQRVALRKAYVSGFFEWPRETDGDTLAESMDVVPSTFHQHLRAAERKLVSEFFEGE